MTLAVVSKKAVAAVEHLRPSGYVDSLRANASQETETHFLILREKYDELCETFRPKGLKATPAPFLDPDNELSFVQKAVNFAASAVKHVAAGMPQASDEEVARRFAICQTCEHYDGKACRHCGCVVVRERKFLSKLSWANEKCPVDKWGPVSGNA